MIGCLFGVGALAGLLAGVALMGVAIAIDPLWGSVTLVAGLLVAWRVWKRFVRWFTQYDGPVGSR